MTDTKQYKNASLIFCGNVNVLCLDEGWRFIVFLYIAMTGIGYLTTTLFRHLKKR